MGQDVSHRWQILGDVTAGTTGFREQWVTSECLGPTKVFRRLMASYGYVDMRIDLEEVREGIWRGHCGFHGRDQPKAPVVMFKL